MVARLQRPIKGLAQGYATLRKEKRNAYRLVLVSDACPTAAFHRDLCMIPNYRNHSLRDLNILMSSTDITQHIV